jgi:glutathione synthase/RimK-type ligase-like ATP-grasp enzyme
LLLKVAISTMLNSQRIFVEAIKRYCAKRRISVDVRSQGWLIVMQRGTRRHFAFGYDVGLNSAMAHRLANDKSATSEVLKLSGVDCIPHALFLNPRLNEYVAGSGSWEAMIDLLARHPNGLVVKPNEGTSGKSVFRAASKTSLELATTRIFTANLSVAIAPYVDIDDEVRVVLVDDVPAVVYSKSRPFVTGDGKRSLLELALAAVPAERRSTVLPGMIVDLERSELDAIVPAGERRVLNWRHNLESGAAPILLDQGATREACVALAVKAARAIGIRFASVDVVSVAGRWQILEVNSGVMMESLSKHHPELVYATYNAALDKVFA